MIAIGKFADLIGQKFNKLTVIGRDISKVNKGVYWLCQCDCGNKKILSVSTSSLKSNNSKSCGCLQKESVIRKNKKNIRIFSEDEQKYIVNEYVNNKKSIKTLRVEFSTGDENIKKILTNNNVNLNKIIPFNENFFEIINSSEKAYWLGFLYADGYVNNTSVELTLKSSDVSHIKKFLKCLNANIKIKHKKVFLNNKQYNNKRILLNSKKIASDLISKGCMQNKSLFIRFPTWDILPVHLQHHFIRGYFDGDGCISFRNNYSTIDIISNIPFLLSIQDILINNCNINKIKLSNHHTSKDYKYLRYGGNLNIYKIYLYLYKNATIYLERKHKIFKKVIKFLKSKYKNKLQEVI